MIYLHVWWHHNFADSPIELYCELDDERWETRKIDVFEDGRATVADGTHQTGDTELSSEPIPSTAEIARDPQFTPIEITQAQFEEVWSRVAHSS